MIATWSLTKQTKKKTLILFIYFLGDAAFQMPNFLEDSNCYVVHLSVLNGRKLCITSIVI